MKSLEPIRTGLPYRSKVVPEINGKLIDAGVKVAPSESQQVHADVEVIPVYIVM